MATLDNIKIALEQRLAANYATTLVSYDNTVLSQNPGKTNDAWIRATFIPLFSDNHALGARTVKHEGIFWIQIFIPINVGTKQAYDIAKEIDTIFSNKSFNEVVCYASETTRTGNEGKGWYRMDVRTPFWSIEQI